MSESCIIIIITLLSEYHKYVYNRQFYYYYNYLRATIDYKNKKMEKQNLLILTLNESKYYSLLGVCCKNGYLVVQIFFSLVSLAA